MPVYDIVVIVVFCPICPQRGILNERNSNWSWTVIIICHGSGELRLVIIKVMQCYYHIAIKRHAMHCSSVRQTSKKHHTGTD